MNYNKAGGHISKITFNNGESLDISNNSIVVFVGSNNVGKSQSLKDIYSLCDSSKPTLIIKDIEIRKNDYSISKYLKDNFSGTNEGDYINYNCFGKIISSFSNGDNDFLERKNFYQYKKFFVANLDTSTRLQTCNPAENINRKNPKTHPIHYAAFSTKYRKLLSDSFNKAFGAHIIPNTQYGATIPLCMGNLINFTESFEDEQSRLETYAEELEKYPQVQEQGDGIKSFVSILLYLMIEHFDIFLIDEPESFLHPPQAYIMGQIIGENISEQQQAFISTHSEEIIKGLLKSCPNRVKIVRISRDNNLNNFSILDSERILEIWSDPILKYSNILTGLFHKNVVLCESDSDCKMYAIIDEYLKKQKGQYSETLFIHCAGKERISKVTLALKKLDVNLKVIVDLDVLNNKDTFFNITNSFGISKELLEKNYNTLVANLTNAPKSTRFQIRDSINKLLNSSKDETLSNNEIRKIHEMIKPATKWSELKKMGISAIPAGDATNAFNCINAILINHDVFIVTVGELENFIKDVGGHGPQWVNDVLEKYPDLENEIYTPIKDFIKKMNL